jgi:hypothetical protein
VPDAKAGVEIVVMDNLQVHKVKKVKDVPLNLGKSVSRSNEGPSSSKMVGVLCQPLEKERR